MKIPAIFIYLQYSLVERKAAVLVRVKIPHIHYFLIVDYFIHNLTTDYNTIVVRRRV